MLALVPSDVAIIELPAMRRFKVTDDNGVAAIVTYWEEQDECWCSKCEAFNACDHTGMLVLSGLLYTDESVERKAGR